MHQVTVLLLAVSRLPRLSGRGQSPPAPVPGDRAGQPRGRRQGDAAQGQDRARQARHEQDQRAAGAVRRQPLSLLITR